jgi:pimeloyl-ACP methyl ester carboxylesterase
MLGKFLYKNTEVRYKDEGYGVPMVLLHGYLESLDIWESFANRLAGNYRVIRPDIPGHGKSGLMGSVHTMQLMAESVKALLDKLSVNKCILIGHSMGGYITMAFVDAYPERLMGFSLFHSTPYADTDEKKTNRDREIDLVKKGKKDLIVHTNIPKSFANENIDKLKIEITRAIEIGRKTPDEGIIALLEGMKQRSDRSEVILKSHVPLLWIFGRKDNYINFEQAFDNARINNNSEKIILENSGHMGFIEEPEKSLQGIQSFIKKCSM